MIDSTARPAPPSSVALVGPGRAGTAIGLALVHRGARVTAVAGRSPEARSTRSLATRLAVPAVPVADAGRDAELIVIATPDAEIDAAAAQLAPGAQPGALVVHLSGARGLDALDPIAAERDDVFVGALHPLQTLPAGGCGAEHLAGVWAAVAGPPAVGALAEHLGMRPVTVDDADRPAYHAAACIASNHLVALLSQVERVAAAAGLSLAAFEPLVRASVDHAFAFGPADALTGPVRRGDVATVRGHLDAISPQERAAYRALADAARQLAGRDDRQLRALLDDEALA